MSHNYYCYILADTSKTLYVGMTNDLEYRVKQHRSKLIPGFTKRYGIDRLVWFESTFDVNAAIAGEKQIKGWKRERKIVLIEAMNPEWEDLSKTLP